MHFTANMEIEECLSAVTSAINNDIARLKPDEQGKWPTLYWYYDRTEHRASLELKTPATGTFTAFIQVIDGRLEDYWEFFNVMPPAGGPAASYGFTMDAKNGFPNVWDRRDLYIHASFVNYTAYGYLGRDGEFYPKPSKIYQFDFQPMQFYFEVSFDGMRPVVLPYEKFEVELSFIIDDKKYQSQ
jgi:hypothetical protein